MSRPIEIVGDFALVTLTRGFLAIIDARFVKDVSKWDWCFNAAGRGYAFRSGRRKRKCYGVYLHRFIWELHTGNNQTVNVDHKYLEFTLDCRLENLRATTVAQNRRHTGTQANNTSGFKGVSWQPATRKNAAGWMVQIRIDEGKRLLLGRFSSAEAGARAYDAASRKYHGQFGYQNFPLTKAGQIGIVGT